MLNAFSYYQLMFALILFASCCCSCCCSCCSCCCDYRYAQSWLCNLLISIDVCFSTHTQKHTEIRRRQTLSRLSLALANWTVTASSARTPVSHIDSSINCCYYLLQGDMLTQINNNNNKERREREVSKHFVVNIWTASLASARVCLLCNVIVFEIENNKITTGMHS